MVYHHWKSRPCHQSPTCSGHSSGGLSPCALSSLVDWVKYAAIVGTRARCCSSGLRDRLVGLFGPVRPLCFQAIDPALQVIVNWRHQSRWSSGRPRRTLDYSFSVTFGPIHLLRIFCWSGLGLWCSVCLCDCLWRPSGLNLRLFRAEAVPSRDSAGPPCCRWSSAIAYPSSLPPTRCAVAGLGLRAWLSGRWEVSWHRWR